MIRLSQEQIDKIHKISDWCIKGILIIGLCVLFLKPGNWFWWTAGILLAIAVIVNSVSAHWATDEEAEEFKKAVREAVREEREAELKKKRSVPAAERVKSPLKGLTPQQEDVIIDILRNKIKVTNGHLKTSELKHLLKALEKDSNLDVSDMDKVIAWVEQITGELVDIRNFKYDYTEKISDPQVTKWGNIVRDRFDRL